MSLILSFLSMTAMGALVVLFIARRSGYKAPPGEVLSLSFFAGMACVSLELFVYYLLGIEYSLRNIAVVPVIMFIGLFSVYPPGRERFRSVVERAGRAKWSLTEKLLLAGIIVQFLWTVFLVLPVPVNSHDAVANYALKAKIFYLAEGIPDGFFGWGEATVAHPDYPLFLPLVLTWVHIFTGFNDFTVNLLMPVIYAAFISLVYFQMKKMFPRAYSLLMAFFLATIPQLADYATIVYADLVLAAFIACALGYFTVYVKTGRTAQLIFSTLLFGFSLWIKNEAMVFCAAFGLILVLRALRTEHPEKRKAARDIVTALAVMAALAAPWFAVKIAYASANSDISFSALTQERIWQNIRDIPVLLNLFQQEVFGPKKWNIFWIMVSAAMIWKRKEMRRGDNLYLTVFLAVSAFGYFAGYMVTTANNLFFYVNTTISRFMLHFCGISLLIMALLARGEIKELESFR